MRLIPLTSHKLEDTIFIYSPRKYTFVSLVILLNLDIFISPVKSYTLLPI